MSDDEFIELLVEEFDSLVDYVWENYAEADFVDLGNVVDYMQEIISKKDLVKEMPETPEIIN